MITFIRLLTISLFVLMISCSNNKPAVYVDKSDKVYRKILSSGEYAISSNSNDANDSSTSDVIIQKKLEKMNDDVYQNNDVITSSSRIDANALPPSDHARLHHNERSLNGKHHRDTEHSNDTLHSANDAYIASDERSLNETASFKLASPLGIANLEWPIKGEVIARFGKHGGKFNEGMDIAAPFGLPVHAIGSGKVMYVGHEVEGYGNLIIISHDNDLMSAYAYLKEIKVERGANVIKGQDIGSVGKFKHSGKSQLHFSIRRGKKTIDPEVKY